MLSAVYYKLLGTTKLLNFNPFRTNSKVMVIDGNCPV